MLIRGKHVLMVDNKHVEPVSSPAHIFLFGEREMSPQEKLSKIKETIFEGNITKEAHASFIWLISRVEQLEKALEFYVDMPEDGNIAYDALAALRKARE